MVIAMAILAALATASMLAPVPWGVVIIRIFCGAMVSGIGVAAFSAGGLAVLPGQRAVAYGWLSGASMGGYAASPMVAGALAAIDLRAVLAVDAALCLMAMSGWGLSRKPMAAPSRTVAPVEVGSVGGQGNQEEVAEV